MNYSVFSALWHPFIFSSHCSLPYFLGFLRPDSQDKLNFSSSSLPAKAHYRPLPNLGLELSWSDVPFWSNENGIGYNYLHKADPSSSVVHRAVSFTREPGWPGFLRFDLTLTLTHLPWLSPQELPREASDPLHMAALQIFEVTYGVLSEFSVH